MGDATVKDENTRGYLDYSVSFKGVVAEGR